MQQNGCMAFMLTRLELNPAPLRWPTFATLFPDNTMTTDSMNALEYAAYVRFSLFLLMGGCAIITASLWLSVYFDYRKANRK